MVSRSDRVAFGLDFFGLVVGFVLLVCVGLGRHLRRFGGRTARYRPLQLQLQLDLVAVDGRFELAVNLTGHRQLQGAGAQLDGDSPVVAQSVG